MSTIISGSSPSVTFSDGTTQTTAFTSPVSYANGGTGLTSLGTAGQVLTVNSGATGLTYSTPSAGAMTLLTTVNVTSTSSFSITGLAAYDKYIVALENIGFNTSGATLSMQLGYGSTPTYNTSYYFYAIDSVGSNNGSSFDTVTLAPSIASSGGSSFPIGPIVIPFSPIYSYYSGAYITMTGMSNIPFVNIQYQNYREQGSGYVESTTLNGNVQLPSQMTAIKFLVSTGNFNNGTISVYGISS